MSLHKMRVLWALLALPVQGTAQPLKYSDGFFIAAMVAGIIGTCGFVLGLSSGTVTSGTVSGVAVLLTTIFTAVGRYLQSKGD